MRKFIFILAIVLPILGGAQIHSGIEKMPDQSKYQKVVTSYKVTDKTTKECEAYIFSDGIVIRNGNTLAEFWRVNTNVYRDAKLRLVEMVETKDHYVLIVSKTTQYFIKK